MTQVTTIAYVNDRPFTFKPGDTILQAVRKCLGKDSVPTLCDAPNLEAYGACRVCSVEVAMSQDGPRRVKASCHTQMEAGMYIYTESADIQRLRKNIIELVLTDHPLEFLAELERVIDHRLTSRDAGSYTAKLAAAGIRRIAQKVGEEGLEVALAATGGTREEIVSESADLIFHLSVLLRSSQLSLQDVAAELQRRHSARG